jgi:hypothetical protein
MAATKILTDWDFLNGSVQPIATNGNFLSSESAVLCAGPPKFDDMTSGPGGYLTPIGLVQNVQISQNKQVTQLFEVGSREPFFIPGRTLVQVGISRALFDGPSLMRAVYEYSADGTTFPDAPVNDASDSIKPVDPYSTDSGETYSGPFYINLASEFFNRPMGLALLLYTTLGGADGAPTTNTGATQAWGGIYLEMCHIQTHGIAVGSQQTVLAENVGIRAKSIVSFGGTAYNPTV